ncbi:MAG TPA: D-alanyl-D-alanine carboxypeptidase [Solirubrobacteraceae bacterium]|nr:D-alanyl-D-alanine carboxypeptidase [Solirubrobacteraceae bacterium]
MSRLFRTSQRLILALGCAGTMYAVFGDGSASASRKVWPYGIVRYTDAPPRMAPASKALSALQRTLDSDLNRQGGANSGLVIDETTDRTLWAYNDNVARLPASVEKLWTTSTALLALGPNATFQTKVLGVGKLSSSGTFVGTLYLRGGGDPTFGSGTFDHIMYGVGATAQSLAANLGRAGVKRIQGSIVGDESYFDSVRGGPDTDYQANLETEGSLSALAYDAGFTNLHEDQLDANPPLVATQAFAAALQSKGVTLAAGTRITTGVTPKRAVLLTSISSPTLARLILLTNSPSDNFFAETLLKDLGAQLGRRGTTSAGAAVVRSVIGRTFDLHPQLNDGSGLSRYDRTNVRQIVLLLREMQGQPAFWNSLAIAGVRGTLIDEMRGRRGANNCRGKTGTLHDVANLVGYCKAANGHQIVFAFMMNGLTSSTAGHELEDLDAEALARYGG